MQIKILRFHVSPVRIANMKTTKLTNTDENVRKYEILSTIGGNVIDTVPIEISMEIPPKKLKTELLLDPGISLTGLYLRDSISVHVQ